MKCKLLDHGLALSYDKVLKSCCVFKPNAPTRVDNTSIVSWFGSDELHHAKEQMAKGVWPSQCSQCEYKESLGRTDSVRGNANNSYAHYTDDDIFLEIRPGNTCNFSCQTCWPAASSRVSSHHKLAFGVQDVVSERYTDYSFLDPIKHRIKDITLLGGEPFYDKNCIAFLDYLKTSNVRANLTMFTNGSVVDWEFIESYNGKLTIVVSLDAYGKLAEYVRTGTDWNIVKQNYEMLKTKDNVNLRVNITCSAYNFHAIGELVSWLSDDWPEIVMIDTALQDFMKESVVPLHLRNDIINSLQSANEKVWSSNIPEHQQHNMSNSLTSIIDNLNKLPYNIDLYNKFKDYRRKLDTVKQSYGEDYDMYYLNY